MTKHNIFYSFLFYFYIEYAMDPLPDIIMNSNITTVALDSNSMLFNKINQISQFTFNLCSFLMFYLFLLFYNILKIKVSFYNKTVNSFFSFNNFYNYLFSINSKKLGFFTRFFYFCTKYLIYITLFLVLLLCVLYFCLIFLSIIKGGLIEFLTSQHNNFLFFSDQI